MQILQIIRLHGNGLQGVGLTLAPYFRIFNPILQGEKFDQEGAYTKKYVPELKEPPQANIYLHHGLHQRKY
jgi:deoxyribodipyrimidine photolyase